MGSQHSESIPTVELAIDERDLISRRVIFDLILAVEFETDDVAAGSSAAPAHGSVGGGSPMLGGPGAPVHQT
jgi:hypothetical protein